MVFFPYHNQLVIITNLVSCLRSGNYNLLNHVLFISLIVNIIAFLFYLLYTGIISEILHQGHMDAELNDIGRQQAVAVWYDLY
jgi:hypothetical protein